MQAALDFLEFIFGIITSLCMIFGILYLLSKLEKPINSKEKPLDYDENYDESYYTNFTHDRQPKDD
jgi:hypothetical protein